MAYTTINKSTDHFNTVTYAGNGASPRSITGVGFQPDLLWLKNYSGGTNYEWRQMDIVRGSNKVMHTSGSGNENTEEYYTVSSFDSDGWTGRNGTGSNQAITGGNDNGMNFAGYCWKAGGTASANSDGTVATSVSANTTAGISVFTYTGTGYGGVTVGHGLGVKPKLLVIKNRTDSGENWQTWNDNTGDGTSNRRLLLNGIASDYNNNHITFGTSTITLPSSNDNGWTKSGSNYLGYAFAEKTGFSAIKEYTGNGNADGTFIYLGFKPAWAMIKQATNDDNSWYVFDNKQNTYNPTNPYLRANTNGVAGSYTWLDFLSNGIKIRNTSDGANKSGQAYLIVAFAKAPLVGTNNIPATGR